MKRYRIIMPVTGVIVQEVQAENEEDALVAFENLELTTDDIVEWEFTEKIIRGNVFYGIQNDMEIEEI